MDPLQPVEGGVVERLSRDGKEVDVAHAGVEVTQRNRSDQVQPLDDAWQPGVRQPKELGDRPLRQGMQRCGMAVVHRNSRAVASAGGGC